MAAARDIAEPSSAAERKRRSRARAELRERGYALLSDVPVDRRSIAKLVSAGVFPRTDSDDELAAALGALLDLLSEPRMLATLLVAFHELAAREFGHNVTAAGYAESGGDES